MNNNRRNIVADHAEEVKCPNHYATTAEAWEAALRLAGGLGSDVAPDAALSSRAGYPVSRVSAPRGVWLVADLDTRLELTDPYGDTTIIWIDACPAPRASTVCTAYDSLKRAYERAYARGDCDAELIALATACARSVVRKCIDPQRSAAHERDTVSNSGCNPALIRLRRELEDDMAALDYLDRASAAASAIRINRDGEAVSDIVDAAADEAVDALIRQRLGDGIDLVQEAAAALCAEAADHAGEAGWLDAPYTVRKLSKRVYVSTADAPDYREAETTPMQEVYRAVRRLIRDSGAVCTDPRNGHTYADALTPDGLDSILYRSGRHADIGGYDCHGNYTAEAETLTRAEALIASMDLTDRQARVLALRQRGYSLDAIARHLGTSRGAISRAVDGLRAAAIEAGIASADMDAHNAPCAARPIEQLDVSGAVLAVYASVSTGAAMSGVDKSSISACVRGKRATAGGYRWRYVQ